MGSCVALPATLSGIPGVEGELPPEEKILTSAGGLSGIPLVVTPVVLSWRGVPYLTSEWDL